MVSQRYDFHHTDPLRGQIGSREGGNALITLLLHFCYTCYTVVTLLLHCCYTVVTLFLHCCYTVVTLWLHCLYIVTLLLHCCHTVVILLSHCCYHTDPLRGQIGSREVGDALEAEHGVGRLLGLTLFVCVCV
jgi:hypothetical protein